MATYTWQLANTGARNWIDAANWSSVDDPGNVPNAAGAIANINSNITVNTSIILPAAGVTVGSLALGDASNQFLINSASAGKVILDNGASKPVITWVGTTATIQSGLAGTNGVQFSGSGRVNLSGASTITGEFIFANSAGATTGLNVTDAALGPTTNVMRFTNFTPLFSVARTWVHPVVLTVSTTANVFDFALVFNNTFTLEGAITLAAGNLAGPSFTFNGGLIAANTAANMIGDPGTPATDIFTINCDTTQYLGSWTIAEGCSMYFGGNYSHPSFNYLYLKSNGTSGNGTLQINSTNNPLFSGRLAVYTGTDLRTGQFRGNSFRSGQFRFGAATTSTDSVANVFTFSSGQVMTWTGTVTSASTSGNPTTVAMASGTGGGIATEATSSTFYRTLTFNSGTLFNIGSSMGLPATTGTITIASGAQLGFYNGVSPNSTRSFAVTGTGLSSGGAIRNISGDNTVPNGIALGGATTFVAAAGTLTFTNVTGITGAAALTLKPTAGAGFIFSTGKISTGSTVTQSDAGTVQVRTKGSNTTYDCSAGIVSPQSNTAALVLTADAGTVTVSGTGKIKTLASYNSGGATYANLTFVAGSAGIHIGATSL